MLRKIMMIMSVAVFAVACGTVAEPVFNAVVEAPADGEAVAAVASPTVAPATATPVPPTATPPLEPTLAPTEAPTEEATEAAVSGGDIVIGGADYGADDPHKFAVDNFADAARGEALFNQQLEVNEQQWACATCHSVADETVKIGPSQLNVGIHALTRVEGEPPYTYLYNSILNSQAYIVPEFVGMTLMPHYGEADGVPATLTNSQVYDLIKYLLTLQN